MIYEGFLAYDIKSRRFASPAGRPWEMIPEEQMNGDLGYAEDLEFGARSDASSARR
ncbi:MAG: hypothetical protein METHAR1v1_430012 [Methanothrix sp.]|nr:MAG: hypothetical protein METHAR1v1_430012 [Methanothrix sp.]